MKRTSAFVAIATILAGAVGIYAFQQRPSAADPAQPSSVVPRADESPSRASPARQPSASSGLRVAIDSPQQYEAFRDRAKADPGLAYPLALLLAQCRQMEATLDAVAEASTASGGQVDAAAMMDRAEAVDAQCAHVPPEDLANYRKLLESAADAGIVPAQEDYAALAGAEFAAMNPVGDSEEITRFKKKSLGYWERAVQAGSAKAMQNLALAYSDGVLTDRDPVRAYSYAYAFTRAHHGVGNERFLQGMGRGLSAAEIQRAREAGQAIYRYSQGN